MAKIINHEERFWSRVDKQGTQAAPFCWQWTGSRMPSGYGVSPIDNWRTGTFYAHRIAYELLVEPIPGGLELDHICRNRWCVNPAHLEPVTKRENVRRGLAGINHRSKTHCIRGHEFNTETTRKYTTVKPDGSVGTHRQCRICKRLVQLTSQRARRARQRGA